jgi:hypothetical protein
MRLYKTVRKGASVALAGMLSAGAVLAEGAGDVASKISKNIGDYLTTVPSTAWRQTKTEQTHSMKRIGYTDANVYIDKDKDGETSGFNLTNSSILFRLEIDGKLVSPIRIRDRGKIGVMDAEGDLIEYSWGMLTPGCRTGFVNKGTEDRRNGFPGERWKLEEAYDVYRRVTGMLKPLKERETKKE